MKKWKVISQSWQNGIPAEKVIEVEADYCFIYEGTAIFENDSGSYMGGSLVRALSNWDEIELVDKPCCSGCCEKDSGT